MVASKWCAWGSESDVDVYPDPSSIHRCNNGAHSSHFLVVRIACNFSDTQGICINMEWREFSTGSDATPGNSQGKEKIRDEAYTD